jgi:outer membrane biogenesis lipoprotein LolB
MRLCWIAAVIALAGCPGKTYRPPSQMPTAEQIVARLEQQRAARTSFRAETTMDYWLGKQRAKGTVYVMGTAQRQVRFNAVKPDGNVLIDMACDGTSFTYVDFQTNCQLAGPCNRQSIARLLRVELEPDDFHDLAQGTPPVLSDATGTVTWDASKGFFRVQLQGAGGKQSIAIDGRDGRFDVVASELVDPASKVVWSVEFTDFQEITDERGQRQRVPGKTRFKSPSQDADLIVDWKSDERAINPTIAPGKFSVPIPEGLPHC